MEPAQFRPSDVNLLGSFPPLCATFGRTECEVAAALMLRVLAATPDNTWRPVDLPELEARIKADLADATAVGHMCPALVQLVADLARNPFTKPDFHGLVARGFAQPVGDQDGAPLEFTDVGRERLRRWVRKNA